MIVKVNFSKKFFDNYLLNLKRRFFASRVKALNESSFFTRSKVDKYIKQGGEGWKPISPFSLKYTKKLGRNERFRKRQRSHEGTMGFLKNLDTHRINRRGTKSYVFYAKTKNKIFNYLVETLQTGLKKRVTSKVRRLFGAVGGIKKQYIEFPKRSIFPEVLQKNKQKIVKVYEKRYEKELLKK